MIHFDGVYVHGFLVFGAPDEDSARKKLLSQLVGRKKIEVVLNKGICYSGKINRLNTYIRTLNHPWRVTKKDKRPVIQYREMTNECVETDYWLKDVFSDMSYCNLQP